MARYESLAGRIEDRIRDGGLNPGARLPSVRELSALERVSPTTAVEAYGLLQQRGWIESRERSGFYVSRRPSPTLPPQCTARAALLKEDFTLAPDDLVYALRQA